MKTLQQVYNSSIEIQLDSMISQVKQLELENAHLTRTTSIYFLNNFTISPIENYLKYYLYQSDIKPHIIFGNYNNAMQEVLDQGSNFYKHSYDIVVCSLMYHPLDPLFLKRLLEVDKFINELKLLFDLIAEKSSAIALINTIIPSSYPETGGGLSDVGLIDAILEINKFIRDYVRKKSGRFYLMDWMRYVQLIGTENTLDPRYWYMYKAPFKKHFLSYYAFDITRIIRAASGLAKKCLILDCDNTLWGGIIGEEGINNIKLDNHEYPGKVYYDFQQTVVDLYQRGIIIALCSKNNEPDVWEVFDNHPYTLLRREHIAHYKINWLNKAHNIAELATDLNISLESMVFIDDNQAECELVKCALPDVTVLQVPKLIYELPQLLHKENLFDTLAINSEDLKRTRMYQQEIARKQSFVNTEDLELYLTSLNLAATIHEMKDSEVPRVSQLTQKTNQFNLSGYKYTQQQIMSFNNDKKHAIYTLHVSDKFGDYGLTGVFIGNLRNKQAFIDSFLLSCRVLGRNLEYVFLAHCLKELSQRWGISAWDAEYVPTGKNVQIEAFFEKAHFQKNKNIYSIDMNVKLPSNFHYIKVAMEELINV